MITPLSSSNPKKVRAENASATEHNKKALYEETFSDGKALIARYTSFLE